KEPSMMKPDSSVKVPSPPKSKYRPQQEEVKEQKRGRGKRFKR
ncbi:hypothetical protein PROFUN_11504, partial [Planoprotostelium fungivorum]